MFTKVKDKNKSYREREKSNRDYDVSHLNDEQMFIYNVINGATATVGGVEFNLSYDPHYGSITARLAYGEEVSYFDRDDYRRNVESFLSRELRNRGVRNIPSIWVEF